jgi:hypothetical protein
MVFVSFTDEFPWDLDDDALAVPLDVGRWALIRGGTLELRRSVAADLRALSRGPAGALTVRLARCSLDSGQRGRPYSLRTRKKARTYPSASVTSKPHRPSSMNDSSFTNDAPRCLNSSNSTSGSRV